MTIHQLQLPLRRYRRHSSHKMHRNSLGRPDFSERQKRIIAWLRLHGASTDRQICEGLQFRDMNSVRPRVTELLNAYILVEVGTTKDHLTGKPVRIVALAEDIQ